MIPYKGRVTLERTIKYLREEVNYLVDINDFNISDLKFRLDEDEISKILFMFYKNDMELSRLETVNHFCEILNVSIKSSYNKTELMELINLYLKNKNLFPSQEYIDKLFSCFSDKKIGLEYLRYIYTNKKIENLEIVNSFINYLIQARPFYVDDRALLASAINLVNSIDESNLLFGSDKDIVKTIEKKLNDDRKANGIYSVDEFTLEELDRKLGEFEALAEQLQSLVDLTEQQINELKVETKDSKDTIANTRIQTLKSLKLEAGKVINNFRKTYLDLLNKEKENLVSQKDMLMTDMQVEFDKKKLELETLASNVGQRIAIELGRIRQQSSYSIDQMKDFISNNEEVKKMFDVAKQDEAFLSRLAKMDSIPMPELGVATMPGAVGTPISSVPVAGVVGMPSIIVPKPEREVIEKVNYYFDTNIPFCDRFKELMDKKSEDIEKTGAIYHKKFDDLLTIILNNDVPYMFGPSGCGKTYMIEKQLAKLLGLDVVTNGFIMYETDILGFNNANGVYVPSNFYRCYKYGDIIFLDELDNSSPSSTIVLNSFIGKDDDSSYTFPNGDRVKRHSNFRILAAGNTRGNGRTESHNTRKKIDEAVMQRFTPIEIDYDNRIEQKILEDYPDWYNFAINFRNAIKEIKIGGADGPNYNGTLTTRDIEAIKRYKRDNSFSDEKIIEYEVIENKDIDYLNQIINEMENLESKGKFTEGSIKLLEKFKSLSKKREY